MSGDGLGVQITIPTQTGIQENQTVHEERTVERFSLEVLEREGGTTELVVFSCRLSARGGEVRKSFEYRKWYILTD